MKEIERIVFIAIGYAIYALFRKYHLHKWEQAIRDGKQEEYLQNGGRDPHSKVSEGIAVLLAILCTFAIFVGYKEIGSTTNSAKPQTAQTQSTQNRKSSTEEVLGLKFYDFDVKKSTDFDITKEGRLVVIIYCKIKNVSNEKLQVSSFDFYLRKEGNNSYRTHQNGSGFTKNMPPKGSPLRSAGVSVDYMMDLFPGDTTDAVFLFDIFSAGGDASGWQLCMEYFDKKDLKSKLFPIGKL